MGSAGARRKAAPSPWCSTRSASVIWSTWSLDRRLARPGEHRWIGVRRRPRRSPQRSTGPRRVAADWESERAVPPAIIWRRTLDDARLLAGQALAYGDELLPGARSYGEVPFGGSEPKSDGKTPWDPSVPVTIPDTGFNIAGYIDRLDIAGDGKRALVRDYKTGRPPRTAIQLDGGNELQRCLYAFAVKALLGDDVAISTSLLYPARADRPPARRP